jgi:Ca2+-dependent lipid-binding protein
LNDIVAQLWPNINVAGCRMIKEIVEPILASTLPGPLSSLRFVKLDLGPVPMRLSEVDVHKTTLGGIKLDMNVTWESKSDIELDGKMVPKIVSHI